MWQRHFPPESACQYFADVSENVGKCRKMSEKVGKCRKMSGKCRGNVRKCYRMSRKMTDDGITNIFIIYSYIITGRLSVRLSVTRFSRKVFTR